jgi:hypothetical protein
MAYTANLLTGERIYLANLEEQTKITVSISSSSQQQNQSNSLNTGKWTIPPTLFKTRNAVIVRIEAAGGQFFLELQRGSIGVLAELPDLMDAEILPLQLEVDAKVDDAWQEIPPMRPMSPMSMGNMQMQMGNMKMEMGKPESSSLKPKFCSQCGAAVRKSDRFCSQCGNSLIQ